MMSDLVEKVAIALRPECFDPDVVAKYGALWADEEQHRMRNRAVAVMTVLRSEAPTSDIYNWLDAALSKAGKTE